MLQFILPFIRQSDIRAIPPYQLFLKDQRTLIIEKYWRFSKQIGHESPGVRLLRYILQFVDMEYMDSQVNNYERYSYHLRFIRRDLTNIFDRVKGGRGFRRLFFHSDVNMPIDEYLFPVEDLNSIVNLPLDTNNWEVWKKVKPLYFWYSDSDEYTIKLINDRVQYTSFPPHYVIELLDVVALAMKYYIWYKYQRNNEPDEEFALHNPQQLFLHRYVVCDCIWDLADNWIIHKLRQILSDVHLDIYSPELYDASVLQMETQYGRIASTSRKGFESLYKLIKMIKYNNVRPEALLSSNTLFTGTINNRILLSENRLPLPIFNQYGYMRWMKDVALFNLFMATFNLRPQLPVTKKLFIHVRRMITRLYKSKPWQNCTNVILREHIQEQLLNMTNI